MSGRSLTAEAAPAKAAKNGTAAGLSSHSAICEETAEFAHTESFQVRGNSALVRPNRDEARVLDEDEARAFITRFLVGELAPLLGLDPSKVEIHVNGAAEARVNAHGATGLMESGRVYLHPHRYDPRTERGRYLLAHETAHVAQRSIARPVRNSAPAEAEADRIGKSFSAGARISAPQLALPPIAAGENDAPAAALAPPPLSESVKESRHREILAIQKSLGGWWVSDGDVFDILEVLSAMPFYIGVAVVQALEPKERYDLVNNINPPHFKHRREVLECYQALEPEKFKKFDEDLFEEMNLSGLDNEEQEAAFYALSHLPSKAVKKLLRSDNRSGVEGVINAPALDDNAREKLREEQKREAEEEAKTAVLRKDAEAKFQDADNARLMDDIRAALGVKPKGTEKLEHSNKEPVRVLDDLHPLIADKQQMQLIGELMEDEKLIDKLIDKLPAKQRFDTPDHRDTFLALLATRLPSKNIALAEELLSYGLFDWRISDDEAEFAYRLIKFLPLTAQQRFRRRDGGKWLIRIEEQINKKRFKKTGEAYEGIEVRETSAEELKQLQQQGFNTRSEDGLLDVANVYAQEEKREGFAQALDALKKRFADKLDETKAAALHRDIAVLGAPKEDAQDGKPGAGMRRMEAIVRELDRDGDIDKLFGELSDKFLFAEENRLTTLRIMVSRDPVRVQRHAQDLVRKGFLHLHHVSDRDAWLAFQLIRALPDKEREAFIEDDAKAWDRILSNMSKGMRADSDLNAYIGDKGGLDRASVLGQLTLAETWSGDNPNRLEGLIRMAIALTEHKIAFEQSKAFRAFENPKLSQIIDDYKLYDPKVPRVQYNPKEIERTKWYETGLIGTLRTIFKGIAFLWHNDFLLFQRSVGVRQLDLNELQDVLGGDIAGVQLAQRAPSKDTRKNTGVSENANKVTLLVDISSHVAEASLPELAIASVNYQSGGLTFQAGNIALKNLQLRASYDTDELLQPTQGRVTADKLEFNDLLLIARASMTAIKRIAVAGIRAKAGTTETGKDNSAKRESGSYLAFPFMTILSALVYYLFKLKGWGTEKPGTEVTHGAEQVRAAELGFDSLEVTGVTTSAGQYLGRIEVRDFALRAGANKTTYLRAKVASLDQRIQRLKAQAGTPDAIAKLEGQKQQAAKDLAHLEPSEKRFLELQRKALHDDKNFTAADQKEMDALQKDLIGGAFLDIGGIKVSGIAGQVTAQDVEIGAIHGEGKSAALGLTFATDADMIQRLAAGERRKSVIDEASDAQLGLDIEKIETGKITVRGMPTAEEIGARIKAIDQLRADNHDETLLETDRTKLEDLLQARQRYERFAAIGVSSLKPEDRAQFDKDYGLLTHAPELIDLSIQHVRLDNLRVGLDAQGRGASLGVGEARISGIELPGKGVSLQELHAKNLRGSVASERGLAGLLDIRHAGALQASAGADLIEATGFKSKFSGIGAEKITLKDFGIDANYKDKSTTLGVHAKQIEVTGVTTETTVAALRYQKRKLLEKQAAARASKKQLSKGEIQQLKDLNSLIEAFESAMDSLAEAERVLASDSSTDAEKADARRRKESDESTLAFLKKQVAIKRLTINDLNIELSGLGDVLDPNYQGPTSLKVQGGIDAKTGKRADLISSASVEGATTQTGALGGTYVENVSIGAVRGTVTSSPDRIDFDNLEIDRVQLDNFAYLAPGISIWGSRGKGPTALVTKFSVTGHIDTPLRDEKAADGDRYMSRVVLDSFEIDSIQGNGLHYRDDKAGLEVEIKSGTLRHIEAHGVTVNLPKTEDEHLLIQGGTAGIGALENARVAASTGTGMAINAQVNASGLTAGFAEDGAVSIDLASLGASGKVTKKDLDVEYNAKARGLHVELIPGKHGYGDAKRKYSASNVDASAKGTASGTRFDASLQGGSVGEVTDDGETINAPNILLREITLNSLHFNNPKYKIDVPEGSPTTVTGIELGVKLERNKDPKTKEDIPFSRIVISTLRIGFVWVHGMTAVLKDYGVTVTLPNTVGGSIKDIYVMGDADHPEGLVIEPTKDWAVLGSAGFLEANLHHLTASMPGVIKNLSTDVGAQGFSIGFLSDGTKQIDLDKLNISNLSAEVKGSKFSLLTGNAQGIHVGKEGVTIDSVGLHGIHYRNDDLGLTLNIESATLPGDNGFKMPKSGPIEIPRLDIQKAFFHIDDLMTMGGPSSSSPSSGPGIAVDPKILGFLDHLDGSIRARLTLFVDYLRTFQTEFPIVINIRSGQLDYALLADKLLTSTVLRHAVKFTVNDKKLVIEIDLSALSPFLVFDAYSFPLDPDNPRGDEVKAAKRGKVGLGTLIKPFLPDGKPAPPPSGPSGLDKFAGYIHQDLTGIEIEKFDLTLRNGASIDLSKITRGGAPIVTGQLILGSFDADAISHLTVKGNDIAGFNIGLSEVNVGVENLEVNASGKKFAVNIPTIHIGQLTDTTLSFNKGRTGALKDMNIFPGQLEGTVSAASVEDIKVDISDDPKAKKDDTK